MLLVIDHDDSGHDDVARRGQLLGLSCVYVRRRGVVRDNSINNFIQQTLDMVHDQRIVFSFRLRDFMTLGLQVAQLCLLIPHQLESDVADGLPLLAAEALPHVRGEELLNHPVKCQIRWIEITFNCPHLSISSEYLSFPYSYLLFKM